MSRREKKIVRSNNELQQRILVFGFLPSGEENLKLKRSGKITCRILIFVTLI
jgi:hypothetical protein